MIAVLIATAVASDYPALFWSRDLGGLARSVKTNRGDSSMKHLLFEELVELLTCQPLPPLAEEAGTVPRVALRLEAARRLRLGALAAQSPTIWRDILNPLFFRRDTTHGEPAGETLLWPDDDEPWPGEVAHLAPLLRCRPVRDAPADGESVSSELVRRAKEDGLTDLASRLAYHRTLLLLREGRQDEAREAAKDIVPTLLPAPVSSFAKLLRLNEGLDVREGYAALIDDPMLGPARLNARLQQCALLAGAGRWSEVVQLTEPLASGTSAITAPATEVSTRYLLAERAFALQRMDRLEAWGQTLERAFPLIVHAQDASADALRASTLVWLLESHMDPARISAVLDRIGPAEKQLEYWKRLGDEAFATGHVPILSAVCGHLWSLGTARERAAGLVCRARAALGAADPEAFDKAVEDLFSTGSHGFRTAMERAARSDAALLLAESLLDTCAESSSRVSWVPRLAALLERCRRETGWQNSARVGRLQAALNQLEHSAAPGSAGELSIGEVRVAVHSAPLAAPQPAIDWPEVPSLLAIPTADGDWRDWFSSDGH